MIKWLWVLVPLGLTVSCVKSGNVHDHYTGYYSTPENDHPRIEVVFVLDATGSMTSLIEGAKRKIWSIANQIVTGDPIPEVRVGLVVYRDRGDNYVVKGYDLTDDIDEIYYHLTNVRAEGGGDFPEDVNQALEYAVDSISWTNSSAVLKLVFLVGDAPPHMDYNDQKHYPDICSDAISRDIIINTIRCGSDANTDQVWQEIAHLAEGNYVTIDYSAYTEIPTPYDDELSSLSSDLYGTVLIYGSKEEREERDMILGMGGAVASEVPSTAADRSSFAASRASSGEITSQDLIGQLIEGTISLEDIEPEELPDELAELDEQHRKMYIDSLIEYRNEVSSRIMELSKLRDQYLKDHQEDNQDAFDIFVIETLKEQADRIGVEYGGE